MATFFNTEDFDLGQEAEEMAFNERYRIARRRMIVHQLRKQKKGEEEEKKRGLRSAVIFPPSGPIPFVKVNANKEEEEEEEAKIIATPEHFPSGPIPFVKKKTKEEEEKPEIIVIPEQFRKCLFSEPKYGNRSETYQQLMIHRDWVTFMDNHLRTITGKTNFYRDWLQEIGEEAKKEESRMEEIRKVCETHTTLEDVADRIFKKEQQEVPKDLLPKMADLDLDIEDEAGDAKPLLDNAKGKKKIRNVIFHFGLMRQNF